MSETMSVQWFPGHMAKTRRLMTENLKLVDAVVEVTDARIPRSSRNPEMDSLVGRKPRIVVLNKCDAADDAVTSRWIESYKNSGVFAVATDCRSGKNVSRILPTVKSVLADDIKRWSEKGMTGRSIRLMIVGIPNVGKSSLINRLAGSKRAKVEDRPGVTKGKQWVSVSSDIELLDMPGVLWPKFEDKDVGLSLAFTGAVKDDIMDMETLGCHLAALLAVRYPQALCRGYKLEALPAREEEENEVAYGYRLLQACAQKRGMRISGGELDTERMARVLLDEYRGGKLGRFTLEEPAD